MTIPNRVQGYPSSNVLGREQDHDVAGRTLGDEVSAIEPDGLYQDLRITSLM